MNAVSLSKIAEINPPGPKLAQLEPAEELDFVPMSSVHENGTMEVLERRKYSDVAKGFTAFRSGDILLAKITPCYENNKISIAELSSPFAFGSTEFHVIRCDSNELYNRYLYQYLRQDAIRQRGKERMTGSGGQRRVPKTFLQELEIPLPPLAEQKRIAAILDQADALRRLRKRAIARLDTLGQAIFYEMFGDPSENPYGFKRVALGEIIDFKGGSQPPKSKFFYENGPNRVRFVQIRDFRTDDYKTYVSKDEAKRPFGVKDVMIGRYGPPVFQIFRGLSGTYNVALMKAQPLGRIDLDFIYYLLNETKLHSYVVANSERTAGQSGVNLQMLNSYPVYNPPIDVQEKFSGRVAQVENCQRNVHDSRGQIDRLFFSLQQRAFRGEL